MSSNPEAQTTFDPNTPADKYYFSAFFNEALRNSAAIIGHTIQSIKYPRNKKVGSRPAKIKEDALHDADILQKAKKLKENLLLASDIAYHLRRNFTLLEAFKEEKITRQVCFLQLLLKLAKEYRNYYSHWHHNPITLAGALPKGDHFELSDFTTCLKKCFIDAVKESKRRFEFSDDIEARFTTGGEKGKKITERYALFDADEKTLSDSGIHFLLCLLLPKDRANLYLSRIRSYIQRTHEKELRAMRQIFTLHCLKLPKSQLVSEESAAALTLDLMAYLARCPIPLYKVLDQKVLDQADRKKFRESADELAPPTEMKRNLERAYYFLARFIDTHTDFGAYFRVQLGKWRIADYKNGSVARHIEQKVYKFDRLGEIRKEDAAEIAAREANTDADKEESVDERSDLKTRLPKILIPKEKEADREWVQYAPHYARHPHAFSINSRDGEKGKPKIIIDNGKVKNHPADRIIQQAPDFVLPSRALPLIAVLLLWNEKHKDEDFRIKNLLDDYRQSVEKFLDEIQAEASNGKPFDFEELKDKAQAHRLKMSWLPRKLIKVLTDAQKSFPDQIQHKLDAEIERTAEYGTFLGCMKKIRGTGKESDERLKYESEIARLKGKYKYKSGAIAADFLRDIWRFTARDKGNMPNASEYQSLQKKLAIYAVHRCELDEDFKGLCFHQRNPFYSALIKGDQKGHFFAKYREIPDAYQAYLKEKKQQLERVKEALKADPEKWPDYYNDLLFALKLPVKKNPVKKNKAGQLVYNDLHDRANLTDYLKNLKEALRINGDNTKNGKTTALGVPPGFFVDCFIRFCEKYKPDLTADLDRLEPVKLIERYLEKEGEGTQEFYGLERAYTYEKQPGKSIKGTADAIHRQVRERMQSAKDAEKKLKEATDREAAIGQIQEIGSQKKKLKEIIHREAEIRYAQATDRVLWLCAKKWLAQHFDLTERKEPKLSDYAAGGNNLLDQTYPFEIQHLQYGHTFEIAVKAKLRDIGKVHALLRDKRLPTLLELLAYPVDQKIDNGKSNKLFKLEYAELEKELKNYEKCRMESLKCIQKFEEKHAPDRKEGEKYVDFEKTLKEKYPAGSMAYIIRLELRKSWMHNEYPFWQGEKKVKKLFDIDKDLKSAYLRYCGGPLDGDKDNHITLHGIEKSSPACFWYEQTQRFFKVE